MTLLKPDSWPKRNLPVKFLAIDGHGGSGKSTLAAMLAGKFKAQIIHTDDFAGWDNPTDWWPNVISRIFDPIGHGETALSYPRAKWWASHHPTPVQDQPVTKVMILEGVTALRTQFRPYLSFGIYVNTPPDVCLERGLDRDRGQDGKSDDQIQAMWQDWLHAENEYITRDQPQEFADLVLDGTRSFQSQLG